MILHVVKAEYVADYRLHVWFNDGTDGEVDLSRRLTGPVFAPLNDLARFREFRLEGHTVAWDSGADLAPEYLHQLVHSATPA